MKTISTKIGKNLKRIRTEKKMSQVKTIGQKIKEWRKAKEITQDALAKKADIPYTTLAKIESDVI